METGEPTIVIGIPENLERKPASSTKTPVDDSVMTLELGDWYLEDEEAFHAVVPNIGVEGAAESAAAADIPGPPGGHESEEEADQGVTWLRRDADWRKGESMSIENPTPRKE